MKDEDLTLKALSQRVFFQTQDMLDVVEMLDECVSKIAENIEGLTISEFKISSVTNNEASGTFLLSTENDVHGGTGYTLKRGENGTINGHCYNSGNYNPFNLNSREGLSKFAVLVYEDAAKQLAGREAAKRYEKRKKPN